MQCYPSINLQADIILEECFKDQSIEHLIEEGNNTVMCTLSSTIISEIALSRLFVTNEIDYITLVLLNALVFSSSFSFLVIGPNGENLFEYSKECETTRAIRCVCIS